METIHEGIAIKYNESKSRFEFTLRGRERSADTLSKAKEAIDKPVADPKKATFEAMEAYKVHSYSGEVKKLRVTSIAEYNYGGIYMWTSDAMKNRSKEQASNLYAVTPENDAIFATMVDIRKQIDALEVQRKAAHATLTRIELPTEV